MLELTNVTKRVGRIDHMSDISLRFERGSLNILLGPTLSGKTTLMRLMAGLDKPTSGDISIDGKSILGVPVRQRNVAMVYQQFINYPGMTVYENIASPMRLAKVDNHTLDKKVREAAALLKLEPYLDRTPLNLSGGQQQRTAIARALVKNAELVLLDEPLANLDYKLREELRVELPRIFAETGAIFVYATTEVNKAGNNLVFGDSSAQLTANQHTLQDGQYTAAIRPHHVSLQASAARTLQLPAVVGTSEITGSETFIHVDAIGSRWVVLTHGVHRVNPGDNITLHVNPDSLYLFDKDESLVAAPNHNQASN